MLIFLLLLLLFNVKAEEMNIIVASKYEDTSWLSHFNNAKIYRPNQAGYQYTTHHDKGFESGMYLKYIIDHYDNLTEYNLFIHGHRQSWHVRDMIYIIPRINLNNTLFKNINIDYYQNVHISEATDLRYKSMFIEIFKILNEEIIPYNHGYCCAQFIVHRDLILRHPKSVYIKLDEWIKNYPEENYFISRAFEYLWSYIFTGEYSIPTYENGLCSIIKCTENELKDKNKNFKLIKTNNGYIKG